MKLCKLVIGVKPAKRMFRITSVSGEVADALIDAVGDELPDEFFTKARRATDGSYIRLEDDKRTNLLSVDTDSVIFTKDHYDSKARINFDEALRQFQQLWQACQGVLKVKDIRRIGIVGEYRIVPSARNPSAVLLAQLTRLQPRGHAAKFTMQFESHSLTTGDAGLPDVKSSDFWNTIETYYDSELDTDHPEQGQITAMLDVQRYFMPLFNGNVADEARKLKRRYDDVVDQIRTRLRNSGLLGEQVEHATEEE